MNDILILKTGDKERLREDAKQVVHPELPSSI